MNWIELGIVAVLAAAFIGFAVIAAWSTVRVNLRLADQNRDLLKAVLVQTGNPAAAELAHAMESGDKLAARPELQRRPRLAGS